MRLPRTAMVAATSAVILVATGGPAAAAAPANDTYPNRITIGSIPYSAIVDTAEATTDADDADLNSTCGAPATDASVWYQVTAATDGGLVADMSRSDY